MEFPFNENSDNAPGNVRPANKVLAGKSFVELRRSPLENTRASCETGAVPPTQLAAVCHRLSVPWPFQVLVAAAAEAAARLKARIPAMKRGECGVVFIGFA